MNVTFWGTRGSIACASPAYTKFGGHTSCVSLSTEKKLMIFDAGSGLYDLGKWVQKSDHKIGYVDLFMTHFHYDHVMGLPFFAPIWNPDFHLTIHHASLKPAEHQGQSFVQNRLFAPPFFPVPFEKVPSKIDFKEHQLGTSFSINQDIVIQSQELNHPGDAAGYRVEYNDKIFSYVTDTEHNVGQLDARVLHLMNQADLAVYDATYTDDEFNKKVGWGHSTWRQGMRLAQEAKVKKLAFFHHAPEHIDEVLDTIEQEAQRSFPNCFMAQQGTTIIL